MGDTKRGPFQKKTLPPKPLGSKNPSGPLIFLNGQNQTLQKKKNTTFLKIPIVEGARQQWRARLLQERKSKALMS
jgi:hypothetical protein